MRPSFQFSSLFVIVFMMLPLMVLSQGEANNWYFGNNAGLSFNTSPPTVLTDGQLTTNEGCSSISTANGDLLFYTDGRTIWNANHEIMPNADYFGGSGLFGDPSSTSSGLIVPHPTQDNLYYVFTVDEPHHDNAYAFPEQGPANPDGSPADNYSDIPVHVIPQDDDGFNNGFNYSVVDMNLNGGLGDVLPNQKNIELITYDPNDPEEIKYKCAEKITAVRGEDCNSIWVITHFKDTFYTFKIDDNGIDEMPISSQVGPLVSTDGYRRAAIGYLKASPSGDKLLTANQTMGYDQVGITDDGDGNVYLFDFDKATGVVSNPLELMNGKNIYSVEFSPEATKAYACVSFIDENGILNSEVLQWNLEADDVPNSIFTLTTSPNLSSGAIQLAPNGKIYRSLLGQSALAVINNPELMGDEAGYTEDFTEGAIDVSPNQTTFGLPPFIQSLFEARIDIVGNDSQQVDLCDGESFTLSYEDIPTANYVWLRDGEVITGENSPTLNISQPTGENLPYQETFVLELDLNDGSCGKIGVANVTYFPNPDINSVVLSECILDLEQNSSEFDLVEAQSQILSGQTPVGDYNFSFFETLEEAQNLENPIENTQNYINTSTPQTLWVNVENIDTGCTSVSDLTLEITDSQVFDFALQRCDDDENGIQNFDLTLIEIQENITADAFYLTDTEALSQTNPITDPTAFTITQAYQQDVFFTIENDTPCFDLGILSLEVVELPEVFDEIAFYCVEDFPNPITISSGISQNQLNNFEFLWLDSEEVSSEIEVNEAGLFEVAITDLQTGCTNFRTVEVFESGLPTFTLEIEEFTRNQNTVTVIVSDDSIGDYEFALDNILGPYQDSNVFENVLSGIHDIFVRDKNGCGVKQITFGVIGIMDFFTPNNDGFNDVWRLQGVFNSKYAFANIYIFDRYGKLLKTLKSLDKFWDGFYNGKPMPSNDYWYRIELGDGRVLKGNFTLKR